MKAESTSEVGPEWVDNVLPAGPEDNAPLNSPADPIVRPVLRQAVAR
jgi:hypothetical protein